MKDLLFKTFDTEIKQEADSRRMTFKISTGAVDRDGDIIDPKGWETDTFMSNPIVLFAHDYKSLPVAKALSLTKTDTSLIAVAEFPKKGVYPFADTVYDMVKGGFLNATSVGFKPLEYEPMEKGYRHTKQTLLEFSIVPVPANHEALVMQRAAGSDDTQEFHAPLLDWCEKFLESSKGKGQWVVGADFSNLVKSADLEVLAQRLMDLTLQKADVVLSKTDDDEDVLAGIEFPAKQPVDDFVFDDETEHILFGTGKQEIAVIVRAAIRESVSEQIKQSVRSEIQYATGRLD